MWMLSNGTQHVSRRIKSRNRYFLLKELFKSWVEAKMHNSIMFYLVVLLQTSRYKISSNLNKLIPHISCKYLLYEVIFLIFMVFKMDFKNVTVKYNVFIVYNLSFLS